MYTVKSEFAVGLRLSYVLALWKNEDSPKTFLNIVMDSVNLDIALSEDFHKLIDYVSDACCRPVAKAN